MTGKGMSPLTGTGAIFVITIFGQPTLHGAVKAMLTMFQFVGIIEQLQGRLKTRAVESTWSIETEG